MTKSYTQSAFQNDLLRLENFLNKSNKKRGGKNENISDSESVSSSNSSKSKNLNKNKKNNQHKYRHFKLIEADKKELNLGYVKISSAGSPLSAAKKLFKSLCHHKNLSGENKLKCSSTFTIQETTIDSKKKIFGPYVGSWKKLSEKEQKEAERAGIKFTMRSIVKLLSTHNNKNKTNKKKEEIEEVKEEVKEVKTNMTGGKKMNKKSNKSIQQLEKIGG